MADLVERMIGAARLDVKTYEEVEADTNATGQALAVVVVSSVAAGLGAFRIGPVGIVRSAVAALAAWFIWALLTYFIGTRILPEPQTSADLGQLLRTTGFSSSPGVLRILEILPLIGGLISFLVPIWMLAAMVVAVRQALDYRSTGRAVGVCLVGWVVYVGISVMLFWFSGIRPRM
jgi:hypothetical protein